MDLDEAEIKRLITSTQYSPVDSEAFDDESLQKYLINQILPLYKNSPVVIVFTAAPASGKTTIVSRLISQLREQGYRADTISTDGFGMYGRKERNEKIAQGLKPHEVKNFELNKRIIAAVRRGESVKVPVYNEKTGESIVAPPEDWHTLEPNLQFLIEEGDFQPLEDPDLKIYLHVPTPIRRKNRIERDMEKRTEGTVEGATPEGIGRNFDFRMTSQYYPYTFPQAEKSDILIVAEAQEDKNHFYSHKYKYWIFKRKN